MILVDNFHFHFSMAVAMPGVVDGFSKMFVIEAVIEWQWEELIEKGENLLFGIGRFNMFCSLVEHFFKIEKICFVIGIHSFEGEFIFDFYISVWILN